MADNLDDVISAMYCQEMTKYRCPDYMQQLKDNGNIDQNVAVGEFRLTEQCRGKIISWYFRVADHFDVNREVVAISVSYLDRFMSTIIDCGQGLFKLAAISSLYLAVKTHEPKCLRTMASALPGLSRGQFTMCQIVSMERIILRNLTWLINPPTTACFVSHFLALLPSDAAQALGNVPYLANFFAELALFDYVFVTQRQSLVAIAAIQNALECMSEDEGCNMNTAKFNLFGVIKRVAPGLLQALVFEDLRQIRARLWTLYEMNDISQYNDPFVASSPDCIAMGVQAS